MIVSTRLRRCPIISVWPSALRHYNRTLVSNRGCIACNTINLELFGPNTAPGLYQKQSEGFQNLVAYRKAMNTKYMIYNRRCSHRISGEPRPGLRGIGGRSRERRRSRCSRPSSRVSRPVQIPAQAPPLFFEKSTSARSNKRIIMPTKSSTSAQSNSAPVQTFRYSNIKAPIWANETDDKTFYSVTFTRSYQDDKKTWHVSST
jgi:hypothetical protein